MKIFSAKIKVFCLWLVIIPSIIFSQNTMEYSLGIIRYKEYTSLRNSVGFQYYVNYNKNNKINWFFYPEFGYQYFFNHYNKELKAPIDISLSIGIKRGKLKFFTGYRHENIQIADNYFDIPPIVSYCKNKNIGTIFSSISYDNVLGKHKKIYFTIKPLVGISWKNGLHRVESLFGQNIPCDNKIRIIGGASFGFGVNINKRRN